jgi:hypothetical protein
VDTEELKEQAARCRRLAALTPDQQLMRTLLELAERYEAEFANAVALPCLATPQVQC